jgi:hypothetical protein
MGELMNKYRIVLAGPAGTGRSSVAEALSLKLGIPFLKAKDITNPILKRDGYDYASGVQVEKFLQTKSRQIEILNKTMEQVKTESFITDRGLIDLAAYAMLGVDYLDAEDIDRILCMCQANIKRYTGIFLFRPGELIDNKKRTLNRHYQNLVYTVELGLLKDWGIDFSIIESCGMDTESKLENILNDINNSKEIL